MASKQKRNVRAKSTGGSKGTRGKGRGLTATARKGQRGRSAALSRKGRKGAARGEASGAVTLTLDRGTAQDVLHALTLALGRPGPTTAAVRGKRKRPGKRGR